MWLQTQFVRVFCSLALETRWIFQTLGAQIKSNVFDSGSFQTIFQFQAAVKWKSLKKLKAQKSEQAPGEHLGLGRH